MPERSKLPTLGFTDPQAKHLGFDMANSLTATGNTTSVGAYQITAQHNRFSTVTSTANSAILPLALNDPYGMYFIRNDDSADTLNLFPGSGDSINANAADVPIVIQAGNSALLLRISSTSWVSIIGPQQNLSPTSTPTFADITLTDLSASMPVSTDSGKALATVALALTNATQFTAAWSTWTPSYSANGSMTYTSVTTAIARRLTIGKLTCVTLRATGTTGGTPSDQIIASLPVAVGTIGATAYFPVILGDGATVVGMAALASGSSNVLFLHTSGNWSIGANRAIYANFCYESA